jgi:hypothetical protein
LCHRAGNTIKFRQCRKRRCVEQIDIPLRKRFGLLAMISEGIFRVQRFAGRLTIRSRADYPRNNDPHSRRVLCHLAHEFDAAALTLTTSFVHFRLARHVEVPSWIGNPYRTPTSA